MCEEYLSHCDELNPPPLVEAGDAWVCASAMRTHEASEVMTHDVKLGGRDEKRSGLLRCATWIVARHALVEV